MVVMGLSDRYVARHVLVAVLVVLSVLLALFSFIAFLQISLDLQPGVHHVIRHKFLNY